MRKYEIMFIVKSNLEEKDVKETSRAYEYFLKDMKSKSVVMKDMGSKKFAHPINKEVRGFYFLINAECNSDTVSELDRRMRIDEKVLRHLIIKEEE